MKKMSGLGWVVACGMSVGALGASACGSKAGPGAAGTGGGSATAAGSSKPAGGDEAPAKAELPQPPESAMKKGKARLVNLLIDPKTKKTDTVDIWAIRSFKYGPTKLVDGLKVGTVSAWFTAAEGMAVVAVPAGATGEGKNRVTNVSVSNRDVKETSILYRDASGQAVATTPGGMPTTAPPDKGLIVLDASPLMAFEAELTASPLGGRAFEVGDGAGNCVSKMVLGGTNHLDVEAAPGKVHYTLHKWPGDCKSPVLFDLNLEAAAGKGQIVYLYTTDGKSVTTVSVPLE